VDGLAAAIAHAVAYPPGPQDAQRISAHAARYTWTQLAVDVGLARLYQADCGTSADASEALAT
jgi:hypothetical protein